MSQLWAKVVLPSGEIKLPGRCVCILCAELELGSREESVFYLLYCCATSFSRGKQSRHQQEVYRGRAFKDR